MPGLGGLSSSVPAQYSSAPRDNVRGGLRVRWVHTAPLRSQSNSLRPASRQETSPGATGRSQREVWNAEERKETQQLLGSSCVLGAAGDSLIYNISTHPLSHPLGVSSRLAEVTQRVGGGRRVGGRQPESFLGPRGPAVAWGVASVSDRGEEVGGMRPGYLGPSAVRYCAWGQSIHK